MKKLLIAVAMCATFSVCAQQQDAGLQAAANDPAVAQMAEQDPEGCQVFVDADGSMKVISTGTGTYDFNDEDEFKDARAEATRNAKAHLVKFFKENFSTEEQATNATKKAKSLHKEGNTAQESVSKEQLKTTVEVVKSDANKVLSGVVVLKEQKIPSSNSGGTIRVTVGVSSTTLKAATKVSIDMSNAVQQQDSPRPAGAGVGAPGGGNGGSANGPANNGYILKSKGAF